MSRKTIAGPFALDLEIDWFKDSPLGMLICAKDWLASSKTNKGYDTASKSFGAASWALAGAPEIFVGASGPSWINDLSECPRAAFWRAAFEARAQGFPLLDFKSLLGGLPKEVLAKGAKNMLILAAKAKDAQSFEELLLLGAARRSKLVMFSAYQNGGKEVAQKVKQPTVQEALEMIKTGETRSCYNYGSERDMSHDFDGLEWLVAKSEQALMAVSIGRLACKSTDPDLARKAVGLWGSEKSKVSLSLDHDENYGYGAKDYSEKDVARLALLSLGGSGNAEEAKDLAKGLFSTFGGGLWLEMCQSGVSAKGSFALKDYVGRTLKGDTEFNFDSVEILHGKRRLSGMTMQAAVCMSGNALACEWLRDEYEKIGAVWLDPSELKKVLSSLVPVYSDKAGKLGQLSGRAVSLSESADLRAGLQGAKVKEERVPKRKGL